MTKNEDLPALTGSAKQITWAEQIRSTLAAELDARLARFDADIADRFRAVLMQIARRQTAARWWIDYRDSLWHGLLDARTDEDRAEVKAIEQAARDRRTADTRQAEQRMKSSEVRQDWREVMDHVRSGGTVIVEHYNRTVAEITPSMRDMSDADLIEMHLSYRPGGNHHADAEVWRRWPDLAARYGRMQAMQQAADRAAGTVDLDELPPETPGYTEALTAYENEARRVAQITPYQETVMATHTLTIVRGEQPGAVGEEFGLADLDVAAEVYAWFEANGTEDDPDVWVLVTPADQDPGQLANVIARRDVTA